MWKIDYITTNYEIDPDEGIITIDGYDLKTIDLN
jgi:hypothetical protein